MHLTHMDHLVLGRVGLTSAVAGPGAAGGFWPADTGCADARGDAGAPAPGIR